MAVKTVGNTTGQPNDLTVATGAGAVDDDTQRLTLASDDPAVVLLGTIDADTSTLAGAVSGTEMQVDVLTLPALPAGTNNIGDVDVATLPSVSSTTDVSLASAATSAQVLAANANRKGLILTNTDANGVYIYFGTTATSSKFTVHLPGTASLASGTFASYEMTTPIYTGRIDAIWSGDGSGALIGSEL